MLTPDEKRAALQRIMASKALTQTGWARAAELPESTLRMFLSGATRNLRSDTETRLARAAGFHSADHMYGIDYGPPPKPMQVWVKGYIGAGNEVRLFEAMGENEGFYQVDRPPGVKNGRKLFAMEIRGASMPPFRDGDVLYIEERDLYEADQLIGLRCMIETADGVILFKELRRGYEAGTYNLISWDGSAPRENVTLKRAMPIVNVAFRDAG